MQQQSPPEQFDLSGMVDDLNALLRLKTTVIGIKMFAAAEEMSAASSCSTMVRWLSRVRREVLSLRTNSL